MNNNIALEVAAFKLAATPLSLDTELCGRTEPSKQIYKEYEDFKIRTGAQHNQNTHRCTTLVLHR